MATIVAVQMRTRIWLLIPIFWPLTGVLQFAPGHLPPRDVAILLVFGAFLVFKALKMVKIKPSFGWLDLVMLINVLYVLSVYIRNPVGTLGMGAGKVGGRPYVEIVFALLAYWVLVRVRIQPTLALKLPFLSIIGNLVDGLAGVVAAKIPATAPIIGKIYGGISDASGAATEQNISREAYYVSPTRGLFSLLCARFVPTTLWNPIFFARFVLTCLCIFAALMSGFRSLILELGLVFILSLYFRKGIFSLVVCGLICLPLLGVLVGLQGNVLQLPISAQRALCFLPGKWDPIVTIDAKGSNEWRLDIWRGVLQSGKKYIADRVWGDGFGFTHRQLEEMASSKDTQENFRITGDYHSGPLSTIRFVGYVGLGLFYLLMFTLAKRGWQQIRAANGTPYFTLALLTGIPMILKPFLFTAVFGAYGNDLVTSIYHAGLFNMLANSLSDYRRSVPESPDPELKRFLGNPAPQR